MIPVDFLLIFPSLFMIHEMEEIIFMPNFISNQQNNESFKKINSYYTPFIFNLIVLEELLLLLITLIISCKFNNFTFYETIVIAYIYHIFLHIGQCILLKKYVPGTASGIITAIYCLAYILLYLGNDYLLYLYSLLTLIFIICNLIFCFKIPNYKLK